MKPSARTAPPSPSLPPTEEEWAALGPGERERLLVALDEAWSAAIEEERMLNPEGEEHLDAWVETRETLKTYFSRPRSRSLYIGANMTVLYPGQPGFAPDLIAVRDVPTHKRQRWAVAVEGKGIDLAMEFCHSGDHRKDFERNVVAYAALGIQEYFALDLPRRRLRGWRLSGPTARKYQPLLPQAGRLYSDVLDLELVLENEGLRFYAGNAQLLSGPRLVATLERLADEAHARADEAYARADEEKARADQVLRGVGESILTILRARGLPLDAEQETRVRDCDDPVVLLRWLGRAGSATAATELFDGV